MKHYLGICLVLLALVGRVWLWNLVPFFQTRADEVDSVNAASAAWISISNSTPAIEAALLNHDYQLLKISIPQEQRSVEDFIASYPSCVETAYALQKLVDADQIAASLNAPGASSDQELIERLKKLEGDKEASRDVRTQAGAEIIREMFRQIHSDNAGPADWEKIDGKLSSFEQEYGRDFTLNRTHPFVELRNQLNLRSKPLDLKYTAVDGSRVDIAKMRGKVVLIEFWATWCGPCIGEVPGVVAAYNAYHARGFEVLGISLDEHKDELLAYTTKHGMVWPQYFDGKLWDNKICDRFGIESIPEMWLVNKKGMLVMAETRIDLAEQVEKLLNEP